MFYYMLVSHSILCINPLTLNNCWGPEKGLIEALPIINLRGIFLNTVPNALSVWCVSHPLASLNAEGSRESYQTPHAATRLGVCGLQKSNILQGLIQDGPALSGRLTPVIWVYQHKGKSSLLIWAIHREMLLLHALEALDMEFAD